MLFLQREGTAMDTVFTPHSGHPPFLQGGLSLQPNFQKGGGLTGPQFLEGGCWERRG